MNEGFIKIGTREFFLISACLGEDGDSVYFEAALFGVMCCHYLFPPIVVSLGDFRQLFAVDESFDIVENFDLGEVSAREDSGSRVLKLLFSNQKETKAFEFPINPSLQAEAMYLALAV